MSDSLKAFNTYIRTIEKELALGNATEHTHRSALKALLESLGDGIVAVNEPRRIECGAPDFVVTRGSTTIGYVEAKDVGKSLDEAERSEQLQRYRDSLTNLVLTDYLGFRWYVDSERRLTACLGTPTRDGRIRRMLRLSLMGSLLPAVTHLQEQASLARTLLTFCPKPTHS